MSETTSQTPPEMERFYRQKYGECSLALLWLLIFSPFFESLFSILSVTFLIHWLGWAWEDGGVESVEAIETTTESKDVIYPEVFPH